MTMATTPTRWSRLDERFEPWASDAFAAGAGLIVLSGVAALGVWAGLGNGFAGTWGFILTGLAVVGAYLLEAHVERPVSAALTAIVAAGVPTAMVFLQSPLSGYGSVRAIEVLSTLVWLAVFVVGGTRGRAIFLGLALLAAWAFVIGEAGNFSHRVTADSGTFGFVVPGPIYSYGSSGATSSNGQVTFDSNGNPVFPSTSPFPDTSPLVRHTEDRRLLLGITSAVVGALYLFALRRADRTGRHALATAFVLPGVVAVGVGVVAIAAREGDVWFGGVLALIAGVAVAWVANGRRRFLTWAGALGAAFGVLLVSGDTGARVTAHHTADGALHYAVFALLFGVAAVLASVPIAVVLREPVAAWRGFGGSPRPASGPPPEPPIAEAE